MSEKKKNQPCNHEYPRGQSSHSGEAEMHSNNWHLDEQNRLYMTVHEMDEEEMPPHMAQKAHREQFNFKHFTETCNFE